MVKVKINKPLQEAQNRDEPTKVMPSAINRSRVEAPPPVTEKQFNSVKKLMELSEIIYSLFIMDNANPSLLPQKVGINLNKLDRMFTSPDVFKKDEYYLAKMFQPEAEIQTTQKSQKSPFINPDKFNEPIKKPGSRIQLEEEFGSKEHFLEKLNYAIQLAESIKSVMVRQDVNKMQMVLEYLQQIKNVLEGKTSTMMENTHLKNIIQEAIQEILLFESELGYDTADLEDGTPVCEACLYEAMTCGCPDTLEEAKYQGRSVPLGKPMRGDVKKFKVYVRDPSTGNIKKVNFGDPNMKIKKSNPKRRKSFRARHNCATAKDRTSARYWSCRAW